VWYGFAKQNVPVSIQSRTYPVNRDGMRLKKDERLRKNSDFSRTYKKGRSQAHYLLVLVYRKNGNRGNRVGFSVSKKYGNAVSRNKIRRRLREIYTRERLKLKAGYDMIFVVRKNAQGAGFDQLRQAVGTLLTKAGLYDTGKDR
jgi:ribonuclease P protein component